MSEQDQAIEKRPTLKQEKANESALLGNIKAMREAGKPFYAIAEELNKTGILSPKGKLWTQSTIWSFVNVRKRRYQRAIGDKRQYQRAATDAAVSRAVVESVLTDPNLTDGQKVRMLTAYLEV